MSLSPSPSQVASPCINICQMDEPTGWCQGCFRNLDEIAFWSQLDDEDKAAVWLLLPERRAQWEAENGPGPTKATP